MNPLIVRWGLGAAVLAASLCGSAAAQVQVQQAYLKASNPGANDEFGHVVAIDGDTLVVGVPREDSNATGVNGDQANNSMPDAGAAYVFVRNGTVWTQQAYLKASNTQGNDFFGWSVSVSGDTIVVGAWGEDSAATGVDGNQSDNSAMESGAAYVFVRNGTTWSQQAYLKASNTQGSDAFGGAVAIAGDTIVVGANGEDSAATGVNGDQSNNQAVAAGAVYAFVRSGTTWSQQAYLKASNTENFFITLIVDDAFGAALAISGDTVVVGARNEDSGATGVDGNQGNAAEQAGAAYVFVRNGTTWSQQAYLKASNTQDHDAFGTVVSVSGDTIVVSAPDEDSSATGIDGNQADNAAFGSGAAYVFVRSGTTWTQQAYVKASNTQTIDGFGQSVSVSGDRIVVGAPGEDSNATSVNGDQFNESIPSAGAVYFYSRSGTSWSQQAYVKPSITGPFSGFGRALALSGDTVAVGRLGDSSGATGVNGDPTSMAGFAGSGSAFVFDLDQPPGPWTVLLYGLAGVSGVPALNGTGTLLAGSPGSLSLTGAAPSALSVLFVSLASTPTPFKCGTLVAVPVFFQLSLFTSGAGTITLGWPSWPGGLSGLDLVFQYAIQDAAAPCGVALSSALRADLP